MLNPYLIVTSAADAISFYVNVFGAKELFRLVTPDGKIIHAEISVFDTKVMLSDEHPNMGYKSPQTLQGSPVSMHALVPDVDALFANALSAGATEVMAVADQFYGDRRGTLVDPFGHIWLLASKNEVVSYEVIVQRFAKLISGESAV